MHGCQWTKKRPVFTRPPDSSSRALVQHCLLLIHLHSCGFTVATFEAAYVFSCSMIINSSPLGPPVTVGPPLLAWYVSVLLSGRGIWCLESLVGFGPASNPVQGPFTLLLTGLPLFAYAFSSACLWLHYPFRHHSTRSSVVDDFQCS